MRVSINIMKVFVVSLTRSIERRKRMQTSLDNLGISFQFFDAIDASEKNFQYSDRANPELTVKRKGYALKASEVACFASHYSLWKYCISINEPIIVLEDNVNPKSNIIETINHCYQNIFKYHYIKLSATKKSIFKKITHINSTFQLGRYQKGTCGTTSYIISPQAAQSFVENTHQILEPVDDYMEKPWRHKVKAFSIQPDLFVRFEIPSTIGGKRKDKKKSTINKKIYIEVFRVYESIMKFIYW